MGQPYIKPLKELLAAPMGRKKELAWTDAALTAFTAANDALANATLLSHPVLNIPTSLMTDASDVAVGAILQQFKLKTSGALPPTFPESSNRLRRDTVPSIENC